MEKYLVLIIFTFSFLQELSSQYEHTSKMIGGNITASKSDNTTSNGLKNRGFGCRINPTVGFFISDKTAIGAGFLFTQNNSRSRIGDITETFFKSYGFGISPLIRTYFTTSLYSEFSFGFRSSVSHGSYIANRMVIEYEPRQSTDLMIRPSIGYSYFLNESTAIEGILRYTYSSFLSKGNNTSNFHRVNFAIGLQVFLK